MNVCQFANPKTRKTMQKPMKAVVITGPTATGKTALAVRLARACHGEIISVDSRQIYRGLDLGTGKDLAEYRSGGEPVPYHLIDLVDPATEYHLAGFCRDAAAALTVIAERRHLPILCGGTALYLDALLRGYELPGGAPDPQLREELRHLTVPELQQRFRELAPDRFAAFKDKINPGRLRRAMEMLLVPNGETALPVDEWLDPLVLGVYYPRPEVRQRIEQRLDARLAAGMIEEVQRLHEQGVSWERLEFFGLEYRYLALYLQNKLSRAAMREQLLAHIRQFAKRQDIWFRKMEREGMNIYWLDHGDPAAAQQLVTAFLAGEPLPEPAFRLKDIHYGPITSGPDAD